MTTYYSTEEICDMAKQAAKKGLSSEPPETMNDVDSILFYQIFYLTKALISGDMPKETATKLKNKYIKAHEGYTLSLRVYRLHTQRTPFIQLAFKKGKDNGCKWCARAEKIFDGRLSAESLEKIDWDNAEVNSDEM